MVGGLRRRPESVPVAAPRLSVALRVPNERRVVRRVEERAPGRPLHARIESRSERSVSPGERTLKTVDFEGRFVPTRIAISDDRKNFPDVFERVLAGHDVSITSVDLSTESAVVEACTNADVLVTDSSAPVTSHAVQSLGHLRAIMQTSTGVDNIDVGAADAQGITVTRAPRYARDDVATHALGLLLACARKIVTYHNSVQSGVWSSYELGAPIHRLSGGTIGVVAFGSIARRFVHRLDGFDVDVVVYDPYVDADTIDAHGARKVPLDELPEVADHVSSHAPLTAETRGMLDSEFFAALDDDAIVVNTGRGGVIDETALAAALEQGELAAAGLDVFDEEPPFGSSLLDRDDVVVTPHAAWYSEESIREANESVAADLARILDGDEPEGVVEPDTEWV